MSGGAGGRVHRKLYLSSALRTAAFYGCVLTACLLFHAFVALGISVFFLRFYRREVAAFLRHPLRAMALAPSAFPPDGYRIEVLPPRGREGVLLPDAGRRPPDS